VAEEIKVRISAERTGNAIDETARDLEKLRRSEADEVRRIGLRKEMESVERRAAGDTAGAAKLQQESQMLLRSATIQKQLLTTREEALQLAQRQIEAERQIGEQARAAAEAEISRQRATEVAPARPAPVIRDYAAEDTARREASQDAHVRAYNEQLRGKFTPQLPADAHVEAHRKFMAGTFGKEPAAHVAEWKAIQRRNAGIAGEAMDAHVVAHRANEEERVTQEKKRQVELDKQAKKEEAERLAIEKARGAALRTASLHMAAGGFALGGVFAHDYFERQGIVNRDIAARQLSARDLALRSTRGSSSSQATAELSAIEDEIAQIKAKKGDLKRVTKEGGWTGASVGAGGGMMLGTQIANFIPHPLGKLAAIAAFTVGGAAVGAVTGSRSGKRAEEQSAADEKRLSELEETHKKAQRVAWETEGGRELEMKEKLLQHDYRASREAEHKLIAWREYNRVLHESHGDFAAAEKAAAMSVFEKQREEVGAIGRAVNARSGGAEIARAAAVASSATGTRFGDIGATIEQLRKDVNSNHDAAMTQASIKRDW